VNTAKARKSAAAKPSQPALAVEENRE